MKKLFILILLIFLPLTVWGAIVYVTPDPEVATAICYRSGAWPVITGGVCQAPATKNSSISDGALVDAGAGGIVVLDGGVVGGAGKTYTDAQLGSSNQIRWQAS